MAARAWNAHVSGARLVLDLRLAKKQRNGFSAHHYHIEATIVGGFTGLPTGAVIDTGLRMRATSSPWRPKG